nr:MAG TPA: hypothetical protein [Caudoviricetes sp.]
MPLPFALPTTVSYTMNFCPPVDVFHPPLLVPFPARS